MYALPQVFKNVSISDPVIHLGMYSKDIIREEGKDVCIRCWLKSYFGKTGSNPKVK